MPLQNTPPTGNPTRSLSSRPTSAEAPPFSLPGSHFAVASGYFLLGAIGLAAAARALSLGAFLDPKVTAVTHLFALGWLTTSIMGALYQFLPVALGREVRWIPLARATLLVYTPGLLLLVVGMATGVGTSSVWGAAILTLGIAMFVINLGATLARAERRDLTWWALALAAGFLVLTLVLGSTLSANLRWWFLGADRLTALVVHLHVALVGWVMLVVVGVGQRLLPMFLLSHGADERPAVWAVGLLSSGTLLLFAMHHGPAGWSDRVPAVLILGGMAAFLLQARSFFKHRRRRALDPGLRSAAAGLVLVATGVVLAGGQALWGGGQVRLTMAYVLALLLGLSVFVAAHYYKIVPFLVFYHRFGPLVGKRTVPQVADLYSARAASIAGWTLASGAATVVMGVAGGFAPAVHGGSWLFLAGATIHCLQMILLSRRGPE